MVGIKGYGYIDYQTAPFWKDFKHGYAEVFFLQSVRRKV